MLARAEARVERWGFQELVQVFSSCIYSSLTELGTHMKDHQGKGFPLSTQICLSIMTWVSVIAHRIKIKWPIALFSFQQSTLQAGAVASLCVQGGSSQFPSHPSNPGTDCFCWGEERSQRHREALHVTAAAQKGPALSNTTHFRLDARSFEAFI